MLRRHISGPRGPMRNDDAGWEHPRSEMRFAVFNVRVCFFGGVWGVSVRQLEWQVEPAGHPRPGLNPMIGSSGARPDKQFHLRHITDTEWKFGCYCRVGDSFLWALLCLCQSGVLLSPWWQCDGPWAPQEWRRTHLKWEVWCIIIFVEISLVNPWKTNHKETVSAHFFFKTGDLGWGMPDIYWTGSALLVVSQLWQF